MPTGSFQQWTRWDWEQWCKRRNVKIRRSNYANSQQHKKKVAH